MDQWTWAWQWWGTIVAINVLKPGNRDCHFY